MQELRDIAAADTVKGKHFFLETDIKGPSLKLDNTGKAILTVRLSLMLGDSKSLLTRKDMDIFECITQPLFA